MAIIEKHYKITNWCRYEEVDQIGKVMYPPIVIPPYVSASGHVVVAEQWLNEDTGDGWEIRTYTVKG